MKKYYIVNTGFYFQLLLYYAEVLKKSSSTLDKIKSINNKKACKIQYITNFQELTENSIKRLINCTGSALFDKNQNKYFAKTTDFYQIINPYFYIVQNSNINNPIQILNQNLIVYKKQNKNFLFEQNFLNFNKTVKKEQQHLTYFMLHQQSKNRKSNLILKSN